jgi:hypothetical protein
MVNIIAAEVNFMRRQVSKRLVNSLLVVKLKIPRKPFYSVLDAFVIFYIDLLVFYR